MASKQFSRDLVREHNVFRKKHGASSLCLSGKLCREAQRFESQINKAKQGTLSHESQ
uniref:SCP domain-containing protein n=1 Tax=Eptatretus burgeri TaxID=7764 RepID=A0A8C4QTJ7_EPTBU